MKNERLDDYPSNSGPQGYQSHRAFEDTYLLAATTHNEF
jgi:DNA polymerase III epsilon subunit-like protein